MEVIGLIISLCSLIMALIMHKRTNDLEKEYEDLQNKYYDLNKENCDLHNRIRDAKSSEIVEMRNLHLNIQEKIKLIKAILLLLKAEHSIDNIKIHEKLLEAAKEYDVKVMDDPVGFGQILEVTPKYTILN